MIQTQPFYIAGLKDIEKCKSSAFGAMGCFIFTFLASVCLVMMEGRRHIELPMAQGGYTQVRQRLPNEYDLAVPESLQRGTFS